MALQNLTSDELAEALTDLPGWSLESDALVRTFEFPSFAEAIAFVNRVATEAEAQDHHPDMDVRYTKVRIATYTHVTGGVTSHDVKLARAIAALASQPSAP